MLVIKCAVDANVCSTAGTQHVTIRRHVQAQSARLSRDVAVYQHALATGYMLLELLNWQRARNIHQLYRLPPWLAPVHRPCSRLAHGSCTSRYTISQCHHRSIVGGVHWAMLHINNSKQGQRHGWRSLERQLVSTVAARCHRKCVMPLQRVAMLTVRQRCDS